MRAGERAYRELRADIVSWRLVPGQVLGEVDLSERLGISRTPVREALSRLTAVGLTAPHNRRGVVARKQPSAGQRRPRHRPPPRRSALVQRAVRDRRILQTAELHPVRPVITAPSPGPTPAPVHPDT